MPTMGLSCWKPPPPLPTATQRTSSLPSAKCRPHQEMWLSSQPPPQRLRVSLEGLRERPDEFRCIGFDCWHDYNTNPAKIRVSFDKRKPETFLCEKREGLQLFQISPVPGDVEYLQFTVLQNFGGQKTYINQLFLFQGQPTLDKEEPYRKPSIQRSSRQLESFESGFVRKKELRASQSNRSWERKGSLEQQSGVLKQSESQTRRLSERIQILQRSNLDLTNKNKQLERRVQDYRGMLQKLKRTVETIVDNQSRLSVQMESFHKGLDRCSRGLAGLTERSREEGPGQYADLQKRIQAKLEDRILKRLGESEILRRLSDSQRKWEDSRVSARQVGKVNHQNPQKSRKVQKLLKQLQQKLAERAATLKRLQATSESEQVDSCQSYEEQQQQLQ